MIVKKLILTISSCLPFLGCEMQQKAEPYEFKEKEQAPERPISLEPSRLTPVSNAAVETELPRDRQDPNKSFHEVEASVVKGKPRHDFPHLTFPE
tara:strand:+ start:2508 stop:2792 length:285 start_codon:yes stop_codon:yes gene_type:complete